jgi:hypothetical protein
LLDYAIVNSADVAASLSGNMKFRVIVLGIAGTMLSVVSLVSVWRRLRLHAVRLSRRPARRGSRESEKSLATVSDL